MSERLFSAGERLQAAKLNRLAAAVNAGVVSEAPLDGSSYVRRDAQWTAALDDAPADGTIYARLDGAWVEVPQRADINTISASTQDPTTAIFATPTAGVLGRFFRCTSASGCAVTLPSFATSPFQAGTMLTYVQEDATAPVTFTAGSGATLVVPAAYQASTAEQYAVVQVVKVSTNTWLLYGHLLPV